MTHKALLRQLQISCLGLDAVDPLRLLVDDVIAALAQTERTWVGLTDENLRKLADEHLFYQPEGYEVSGVFAFARAIEAKLKEKTHDDWCEPAFRENKT
jgi:crotonobetainyl-CoA:carnitine CoA-transferase CaiB-like acyl-CoA transferase